MNSINLKEDISCLSLFGDILSRFINTNGLSFRDWQEFIALDFGIRFTILISTAIGNNYLVHVSFADTSFYQTIVNIFIHIQAIKCIEIIMNYDCYF